MIGDGAVIRGIDRLDAQDIDQEGDQLVGALRQNARRAAPMSGSSANSSA